MLQTQTPQSQKKQDPEYIQAALNHITWWRHHFGLESQLQKLYKTQPSEKAQITFDDFSTNYKKFIDSISSTAISQISNYKEDTKFIEHLLQLTKHNIYAYCIELGYAQNPNNYSYSYAAFFVPKTFVKKIKEIADADESIVIYLTDFTWELEQRTRENYLEPNTVARELRNVTNDVHAKYYNYIWKRFPCEIFSIKSQLFKHISEEYISMQIRHSKPGNHMHWLINTVGNIVG